MEKWKKADFINTLLDGEQIIGRYYDNGEYHTIYGIAHIFGVGEGTSYIETFSNKTEMEKYVKNEISKIDLGVIDIKGGEKDFVKTTITPSTGKGNVTITPELTIGTFGEPGTVATNGVATIQNVTDVLGRLKVDNTITDKHYINSLTQANGKIEYGIASLPVHTLVEKGENKGIVTNITLSEGTIKPTYRDATVNSISLATTDVTLDGSNLTLTGYSNNQENTAVVASDSINEAISKLEKQIADATSKAGVTSFTGSIASDSANYLTIDPTSATKQTGDAKLTIGATIGTYTDKNNVGAGLVDTTLLSSAIKQIDGSNVQITGYSKATAPVGAISGTDSINVALGKLEGKIDSIKIVKNETPETETSLVEYQLEVNGTKLADTIVIPKDRTLAEVQVTPHTATGYDGGVFTYDVEDKKESLSFAYIMADGSYSVASIPISSFATEALYGDGIKVVNSVVQADLTDKGGLTFDQTEGAGKGTIKVQTLGENPIKVDNSGNVIYEIEKTDDDTSKNYVTAVTQAVDGKITVTKGTLPTPAVSSVEGGDGISVTKAGTDHTVNVAIADNSLAFQNTAAPDQPVVNKLKVQLADESLTTDAGTGVSVGIVDCGTY